MGTFTTTTAGERDHNRKRLKISHKSNTSACSLVEEEPYNSTKANLLVCTLLAEVLLIILDQKILWDHEIVQHKKRKARALGRCAEPTPESVGKHIPFPAHLVTHSNKIVSKRGSMIGAQG